MIKFHFFNQLNWISWFFFLWIYYYKINENFDKKIGSDQKKLIGDEMNECSELIGSQKLIENWSQKKNFFCYQKLKFRNQFPIVIFMIVYTNLTLNYVKIEYFNLTVFRAKRDQSERSEGNHPWINHVMEFILVLESERSEENNWKAIFQFRKRLDHDSKKFYSINFE